MGRAHRLGTAIGQTGGQEEQKMGATGFGAMANRGTDAGAPSAGAAKRGWFLVQGVLSALKKLQRVVEVPENAADEGKFLLMAAFVGVLTGTSGMYWRIGRGGAVMRAILVS